PRGHRQQLLLPRGRQAGRPPGPPAPAVVRHLGDAARAVPGHPPPPAALVDAEHVGRRPRPRPPPHQPQPVPARPHPPARLAPPPRAPPPPGSPETAPSARPASRSAGAARAWSPSSTADADDQYRALLRGIGISANRRRARVQRPAYHRSALGPAHRATRRSP